MPTYQYRCPKCGHDYEALQKISDNSRAKCPQCKTRGERIISGGAGLIFKGSGFYITDYARKGAADGDKAESGAKTEKSEKPEKTEKTEQKPAAEKTAAPPKKTPKKGADS